jgi:hypothetical protein
MKARLDVAAIDIMREKKVASKVAKEIRNVAGALYLRWPRGRGGIGRRIGLKRNLSARRETGDVELLKFGEPCQMAIPSQVPTEDSGGEGVETRRAAPDGRTAMVKV